MYMYVRQFGETKYICTLYLSQKNQTDKRGRRERELTSFPFTMAPGCK